MSNPKDNLEYIKNNLKHLPKKDITIAEEKLRKREFTLLQEIVDSALYKVNKNLASENPKEEYRSLNLEAIEDLAVRIDEYTTQVYGENIRLNAADLEDDEEDYYENFNEYDLNDIY